MSLRAAVALDSCDESPEYDDWLKEHSFVISGPLVGNAIKRPWERFFKDRAMAMEWVAATYGRFTEIYHPRRWAARVTKPTSPGGRYTPPESR